MNPENLSLNCHHQRENKSTTGEHVNDERGRFDLNLNKEFDIPVMELQGLLPVSNPKSKPKASKTIIILIMSLGIKALILARKP